MTQTFNMLFSCVPFGAKISLNQALDTECTEAEPEDTEHPRWMGIFCRGSNLCALAS